jgi:hypothetical protein
MRCDTSAMLSEEWPMMGGELITSATVRTVGFAGMRPPYRAGVAPEHAANRTDQTLFTLSRHVAHLLVSGASRAGAKVVT